jgi:ribokinase
MSVVVLGSINTDLTTYVPRLPGPGETLFGHSFITVPGGKGANQAVACARLGVDTKMVGRVGNDGFGKEPLRALETEGVDTSSIFVDDETSTGLAVICVDDAAENSIIVISGANMSLNDDDVARCKLLLSDAEVVMLQNEVPLTVSIEVAREAHAKGIKVIHDPAPAKELPKDYFPHIDVITPNEVEAEALVGFPIHSMKDGEKAAAQLRDLGVGAAVIKMGKAGAYFDAEQGKGMIPAFHVDAIDTVAAGDAFNGGFAAALIEGKPFDERVRWGVAAGALAVTKRGAMPSLPFREDFEAFLSKDGYV